jgi:7,8-dihydropterin-6-yl-methyl-4-(beta-D-ribofuranosyl)aminobenzene 5'-phosphate synthase
MLLTVESNNDTEPKSILWDVGSINFTILHNLPALGRSFSEVERIALSHGHYDHAGSLSEVLREIGHPVEIFAHPDVLLTRYFSRSEACKYENLLGKSVAEIEPDVESGGLYESPGLDPAALHELGGDLQLSHEITDLFENKDYKIWTTGEVPRVHPEENFKTFVWEKDQILVDDQILDDQSLVIERKGPQDTIVLLGCCHAGLMNTVKLVEGVTNTHISVIVGGTHMDSAIPSRLDATLQFLGERAPLDIFPVHCSGAKFLQAINGMNLEGLRAFDASVLTQFSF